ncbi:MAG: hypothetical protein HWN67_12570 [Candidatus Helarchaeota archaeon]|nr:hypothetical protein [Candidatus Helarchaeota archaeon]
MDIKDLEKNAAKATESPESAIKYVLDCLYVYQKVDDKAMGYFGYVLSKDMMREDASAPSGLKPGLTTLNRIKGTKEHQRAYGVLACMGASWEKDYKDIDVDNYKPNILKVDKDDDKAKVVLKSGGHDNPISIKLAKNNKGQWKIISGFTTLTRDSRKPKSAVGDF